MFFLSFQKKTAPFLKILEISSHLQYMCNILLSTWSKYFRCCHCNWRVFFRCSAIEMLRFMWYDCTLICYRGSAFGEVSLNGKSWRSWEIKSIFSAQSFEKYFSLPILELLKYTCKYRDVCFDKFCLEMYFCLDMFTLICASLTLHG